MKRSHLMYFLFVLMLLISACAPGQVTADPQQALQQIETAVALTVAADDAQTAAAVPANTNTVAPPTNTPFPTLTPYPTLTPFVVTPGPGNGNGNGTTGGGGPTQDPRYMCQLIDQRPLDGSPNLIIKTGEKLDVRWTLKNIGLNKWEAATFGWIAWKETVRSDIPNNKLLTTNPQPLSIGLGGVDVLPKEWIELGVELTAPATFEGQDPIYITVQMALVAHGVKFCTPWVQIEVIRPGMTP